MATKGACALGLIRPSELRAMLIKTLISLPRKVACPRVPGLMISCLVEPTQVGHLLNVEEGELQLQTKKR